MISTGWSYKKKVLILILAVGVLRLLMAFMIPLGNDESYYWVYSQHLKPNYFDHPPMVALWIRATTLNLLLQDHAGFIRLGSVISCCLATWFMFKCVAVLINERAGWFAACLYNAFFYAGVTAGIFAMPDAPEMLFWTWSMYLIVRITQNENKWNYWLLFGVASGLCIMSKVHGFFIWIGVGGYVLFYKRRWLFNPKLYAALVIAIVICLPLLFWNIHYNFITWKFNGPRIEFENAAINWHYFFDEISAQVFKNNPLNVAVIIVALFALQRQTTQRSPALTIFNFAGLSLALILLLIALHKETLAHWSGPAYIALTPVAAAWLDKRKKQNSVQLVSLSLGMHVFVLLYCAAFINYYPGTYGVRSGRFIGIGDKSLDLFGWNIAGKKFDSIYLDLEQRNIIPHHTPVVGYRWWDSHIEYYFCRPSNIKMIGLGDVMDLHEYVWMNRLRKDSVNMQQAFCIIPSDGFYNVRRVYANYYSHVDSVTNIQTYRVNEPAHNFYVYHLWGWKGNMPMEQ